MNNLTSKDGSTAGGREFADFVVTRGPSLHRTALLLTHQEQAAQDLVQAALAKASRSWAQIGENPEAQVRAIMINEFVSSWRRRGELSGRRLRAGEHPVRRSWGHGLRQPEHV